MITGHEIRRVRSGTSRSVMVPKGTVSNVTGPVDSDLARLDATAQAELVRSGQASPLELVDAAIARIEAVDPQLNAVIHRQFDEAREQAGGDLPDGPFRGV